MSSSAAAQKGPGRSLGLSCGVSNLRTSGLALELLAHSNAIHPRWLPVPRVRSASFCNHCNASTSCISSRWPAKMGSVPAHWTPCARCHPRAHEKRHQCGLPRTEKSKHQPSAMHHINHSNARTTSCSPRATSKSTGLPDQLPTRQRPRCSLESLEEVFKRREAEGRASQKSVSKRGI